MIPCQFSETQFSFCFTFEYIKQFFPSIPLPIFPNIVKEGRTGGGYDVQINGSLFFQFKVPSYFDKYSHYGKKFWAVYTHDYYKIKIETNDKQFQLLKQLNVGSNQAYYVTPEFYELNTLATHYTADAIVPNSSLFSIDFFPPYGSGHHHLIYSPKHDWGRLFSQPQDVKKTKSINPFELFQTSDKNLTIYQKAIELSKLLREMKVENFEFNDNKPAQLVKEVYTALLVYFNVHWYPVVDIR